MEVCQFSKPRCEIVRVRESSRHAVKKAVLVIGRPKLAETIATLSSQTSQDSG
jgi:hypothetical protein